MVVTQALLNKPIAKANQAIVLKVLDKLRKEIQGATQQDLGCLPHRCKTCKYQCVCPF